MDYAQDAEKDLFISKKEHALAAVTHQHAWDIKLPKLMEEEQLELEDYDIFQRLIEQRKINSMKVEERQSKINNNLIDYLVKHRPRDFTRVIWFSLFSSSRSRFSLSEGLKEVGSLILIEDRVWVLFLLNWNLGWRWLLKIVKEVYWVCILLFWVNNFSLWFKNQFLSSKTIYLLLLLLNLMS